MTRVWGKEGYLAKMETVMKAEETAQTEVPCPLSAIQEGGSASRTRMVSLTAPGPTPQADREKQQLASSLFVGLGSQSAAGPCLVR